ADPGVFVITVDNVSKSYPSTERGAPPVRALHNVSLEVATGSLHGIVGTTGAGKSTLANCLALRDLPDSGAVRFEGADTAGADHRRIRRLRRQVGFVDSRIELQHDRTVAGNVAAPLERRGFEGAARRAQVAKLLVVVGVDKGESRPRY